MAALDIRHLTAPFNNKINLVVIISVVVLFAIFRFSINERAEPMKPKVNFTEIKNDLPKNTSQNLIDELLGDQPLKRPTQASKEQQPTGAPFKDIEEALGIVK